ncbi:C-C motif chemokine 4 homolog [Sinocyclocheilus grahami]|uniref:C-C motif chemokine 4 homolog n=2 Tax=Sinocyclocheilus grahami TaxID=75366 RepID=A0A672QHI7_SINGR|nr:PREDICTED: C-C motif chemokine 4 homolog [Sinocyclocheilus grahami]
MRASSLCLVFGLVLLMAWTSEAQPKAVAHAVPESCCFDFVDFQIPTKRIVSALKTGSNCPVAGIVVKTPRTEFCVKPNEAWIQKVMKKGQK